MDPPPIPPIDHETGLPKDPQMVRHQRLPDVYQYHQLAHRALAGPEMLEDSEPGLVAEGAEA